MVETNKELHQIQRDLEKMIAREKDRKNRKRLGLLKGLGVIFLVTFFSFSLFWSLTRQPASSKSETQLKDTYQAKLSEYQFNWTMADYDKIYAHYDMKGSRLEDVVATYGKPSRVSVSGDLMLFTYDDPETEGDRNRRRVKLGFSRNDDGFYLNSKEFRHFPLPDTFSLTTNPNGVAFTKKSVEKLAVGSVTGIGGETLAHILETYRVPDQLTVSRQEFDGELEIEAAYQTDYPDYSTVRLTFKQGATDDWFLVRKYSYFTD